MTHVKEDKRTNLWSQIWCKERQIKHLNPVMVSVSFPQTGFQALQDWLWLFPIIASSLCVIPDWLIDCDGWLWRRQLDSVGTPSVVLLLTGVNAYDWVFRLVLLLRNEFEMLPLQFCSTFGAWGQLNVESNFHVDLRVTHKEWVQNSIWKHE